MKKKSETPPLLDTGITLRPGEGVILGKDEMMDWAKQTQALRQIRGNVIARSLELEFALDTLIRELLFPYELESTSGRAKDVRHLRAILDQHILKSGILSFNGKVKILHKLTVEGLLQLETMKEIFCDLEKVRKIRNQFAHMTIGFEPKSTPKTKLIPYMIISGERVYLDNNYFNDINSLFERTHKCLNDTIRGLHPEAAKAKPTGNDAGQQGFI